MAKPARTPRESWLRSDEPDEWAAAMMCCRHPGAFCGSDGYCHYAALTEDGRRGCFSNHRAVAEDITDRLDRIERTLAALLKPRGEG